MVTSPKAPRGPRSYGCVPGPTWVGTNHQNLDVVLGRLIHDVGHVQPRPGGSTSKSTSMAEGAITNRLSQYGIETWREASSNQRSLRDSLLFGCCQVVGIEGTMSRGVRASTRPNQPRARGFHTGWAVRHRRPQDRSCVGPLFLFLAHNVSVATVNHDDHRGKTCSLRPRFTVVMG